MMKFNAVTKNKEVIFTDFFDTLVFRKIHPSQTYLQWGKNVVNMFNLYPTISAEEIVKMRLKCEKKINKEYKQQPYKVVISMLYNLILDKGNINCTLEKFLQYSLSIEIAVELGCQYRNKEIYKFLLSQKMQGKRIYIISDFYLPKVAYIKFLENIKCESLIDDIFVSEEVNETKSDGSLYLHALKEIGVDSKKVFMIGDNKHADKIMAEKVGISAVWYIPFMHKITMKVSQIMKLDFSKKVLDFQYKECRKKTLFGEYILPLFYYTQKLSRCLNENKLNNVCFMAREGYYLKKLFDKYQQLCVMHKENINSQYFKNSRVVNLKALDAVKLGSDENVLNVYRKYVCGFARNNSITVADVGWNCTSQEIISEVTELDSVGYYIGTFIKKKLSFKCDRKGILFDMDEANNPSWLYWIFRTNCSLYEQILAAPHGSLKEYLLCFDGSIGFKEIWDDKEREIYDKYISELQQQMMLVFQGLCAWSKELDNIDKYKIACKILKTSCFANKERLKFLNDLDASFVNNVDNNKTKVIKGYGELKINPIQLLLNPDLYLHYFCKIERKLVDHSLFRILYYPIAACYYIYVRIHMWMKK